jgi:tocopherol O-methyltransferase
VKGVISRANALATPPFLAAERLVRGVPGNGAARTARGPGQGRGESAAGHFPPAILFPRPGRRSRYPGASAGYYARLFPESPRTAREEPSAFPHSCPETDDVETDADTGARTPEPFLSPELSSAIERYYDTTLDLYEELWGEHVHHGYWDVGESPAAGGADRHAAADRLVRELISYAGVRAGTGVLDVGCGIGGPALYLAGALGCVVDGITLSPAQVARAEEKARAAGLAEWTRFSRRDALATGLPDESFDVVWAVESLAHLPDCGAFYAEALRLLRPGGTLAAATWAIRDGALDDTERELLDQVVRHQVMPGMRSLEEHARLAAGAGFAEVGFADWSANVANSWDPRFTQIRPLERGPALMRNLARERGVDVLGFFYAGPVMKKGFDTGVVRYGALRAVKPGDGPARPERSG